VQVRDALHRARRMLEPVSDSSSLDARVLLADTLGATPSWLLAHDDEVLPPEAAQAYVDRLRRVAGGEPLPYVLGWWEFYGRRFVVSSQVLIPRPETELIVEVALEEIRRRPPPLRLIDVGTGTGCIAVSLAAESPSLTVFASDISLAALEIARTNAVRHGVRARLNFLQASVLDGIAGRWDVLCANLPYIPSARLPELEVSRHEPQLALDGGRRGTMHTARLIRSLPARLAPGGVALVEMDETQAEPLVAAARDALEKAEIDVRQDLAGRPRLLQVRRAADGH
jgi:release factor glutamine methyltransferase